MKKKTMLLAALAAMLLALLCACGGNNNTPAEDTDYPAMEAADLSAMELGLASNSAMSAQYNADEWYGEDVSGLLTFYYLPTLDTDNVANVNAQKLSQFDDALDSSMAQELEKNLSSNYAFLSVGKTEMKTLNGAPVIYMEGTFSFTDEVIDFMLKDGGWTQEDIDALGGREAILALPETNQSYLYTVKDGWLYLFTGTYYAADQGAAVLECMTVLAQTAQSAA